MIALLLAALLSTGREIVVVMPQLAVRHDAIIAELAGFLEPEDQVAVVDGDLRLIQDFTKDRKAMRSAIRSTKLGTEPLEVGGKLLVVVTYGVNEPNAEPMQLPPGTLLLNTSRAGEISAGFVTEGGVTLHPRTSLRRVAELAPNVLAPSSPPQASETITVARYVVSARVVDSKGDAIRGLGPSDFAVTIAGKPAHVESLSWEGTEPRDAAAGRLLLFFIGTDFARSAPRMAGQLRLNELAAEILELLGPNDRAAVVSHDSRLQLRIDFTNDREAIRRAISDSIGTGRVPPPPPQEDPSLGRHLDGEKMRLAAKAEAALLLAVEALRAVEGENKILIIASYGLGERHGPRMHLDPAWHTAMGLLQTMRVPAIVLNTGVGGELSIGLAATSRATSGVYSFIQSYPDQSVRRVAGVLAGRYELVLRTDEPVPPGRHALGITVKRKDASLLAPKLLLFEPNDEAAAAAAEAAKETPYDEAMRLFVDALRRLHDGDEEGVEATLDEVIAKDPQLAEAWYERGMLAAAREDHEAAERDLKTYLKLAPQGKHAADAREFLDALQTVRPR